MGRGGGKGEVKEQSCLSKHVTEASVAWSSDSVLVELRTRMGGFLKSFAGEAKAHSLMEAAKKLDMTLKAGDLKKWEDEAQAMLDHAQSCVGLSLPAACLPVLDSIFTRLQGVVLELVDSDQGESCRTAVSWVWMMRNFTPFQGVDSDATFAERVEPLVMLALQQALVSSMPAESKWLEKEDCKQSLAALIPQLQGVREDSCPDLPSLTGSFLQCQLSYSVLCSIYSIWSV